MGSVGPNYILFFCRMCKTNRFVAINLAWECVIVCGMWWFSQQVKVDNVCVQPRWTQAFIHSVTSIAFFLSACIRGHCAVALGSNGSWVPELQWKSCIDGSSLQNLGTSRQELGLCKLAYTAARALAQSVCRVLLPSSFLLSLAISYNIPSTLVEFLLQIIIILPLRDNNDFRPLLYKRVG